MNKGWGEFLILHLLVLFQPAHQVRSFQMPMSSLASEIASDYAAMLSLSNGFSSGWIFKDKFRDDCLRVMLKRSVRDLDSNKMRSFLYNLHLNVSSKSWSSVPFPQEMSNTVVFSPSPSGERLAIVKETSNDDKNEDSKEYTIELWHIDDHAGSLVNRISTGKLHGKIMTDSWFGGFEWSHDETHAVYVAKKVKLKTKSFFSEPIANGDKDGNASIGNQYEYREDWGEQYTGVVELGLYIVNFDTGKSAMISGIDENLTPGQPHFAQASSIVVYTAWSCSPRKLGMIYCYQRPCKLYSTNVIKLLESLCPLVEESNEEKDEKSKELRHVCLTPEDSIAQSPRISPCGTRIAWLSRKEGFDTHSGALRLTTGKINQNGELEEPKIVLDIVQVPSIENNGFPGLWTDALPRSCWSNDGSSIYVSSLWGSVNSVICVEINSGHITRLDSLKFSDQSDSSIGLLNTGIKNTALVSYSSPNCPSGCSIMLSGGDVLEVPALGPISITSGIHVSAEKLLNISNTVKSIQWKILKFESQPEKTNFEAILMKPKGSEKPLPLIVVPHGGPHGCIPTSFLPTYAFLCTSRRYAILHVNFRGSTGFGELALNSLPGYIGIRDVDDVVQATHAACSDPEIDGNRVGIVGGSHGGYLTCHLTARYPHIFKVAAMRNPVTNIPAMVTTSDIPDWCFIESLGIGSYDFSTSRIPTGAELDKMLKCSPCLHVSQVTSPSLIALGAQDRRVPHSQGLEWYQSLKSRGIKTKLLVYPEDMHAIDKPQSEADFWVNAALWFEENL